MDESVFVVAKNVIYFNERQMRFEASHDQT